MPKISVIIPVYKVEQYLPRCVDSLLSQSFADFELILVDDGSPDNCPALCDEYSKKDNRIVVIHKNNGGLSDARNAGIDWAFENSDSEWLTFIDSDDWVHEKYLEILFHATTSMKTSVGVCNFKQTAGEDVFMDVVETPLSVEAAEHFYVSKMGVAVIACAKLYKKKLFSAVRYPVGRLHEDEFTTYKLLFAAKQVAYVSTPLYAYYQNQASITRSAWNPKRMEAYDAAEEQIEYFKGNGYVLALRAIIRARLLMLEKKWDELKEDKSDNRLQRNAYRLKRRCFAKKYAKYLLLDDPYDEWVLAKIRPIRTKIHVFFRTIKRKIQRNK